MLFKNFQQNNWNSILVLILSLFFVHSSDAQLSPLATLTGRVLNEKTKEPILGAIVAIPDLKIGTVSDELGKYAFTQIPNGNFLVEVNFIGFKSINQLVSIVNGGANIDFFLLESAIEESEIVVTGLSKATEARRSPVPIVLMKKDYLDTHQSDNIIDAISKVPGVSAVSTGPNVSKPVIRGLGFNRILVLHDGIRQEGQQWGDEHGIEVEQYGIEKVEVIKGPASLSFGSDALAGVVNLIPTAMPSLGKLEGEVISEYHTNNGMLGISAALGGNKKGFEWLGRLTHKEATNYQNAVDGRVYGTAFNETDARLALGLHGEWGFSHLAFSLYDDTQKIPDGSRDSTSRKFTKQITEVDTFRLIVSDEELRSYETDRIHQRVQHYRIATNNVFIIDKGILSANFSYQLSKRREFSHPEQIDIPGLYLNLKTVTYDLKYDFPESKNGMTTLVGINGMYQINSSTGGTDFLIPDYSQFDIGLFSIVKKTFGNWDVSGGLRYDHRKINGDALHTKTDSITQFQVPVLPSFGSERVFDVLNGRFWGMSGSLGATYKASKEWSIKANISRGYRAPNIAELSANGAHAGTQFFQIGNADFLPEFGLQEDLGATYTSKRVSISLSIFNNLIEHYIFNQQVKTLGGADSISSGLPTFKYQQGSARLYGGELSFDYHPISSLHFENSLALVFANGSCENNCVPNLSQNAADSSRYLPNIPPLHTNSELRYNFDYKPLSLNNAFIYGQLEWYAPQNRAYLANNTETPTAGYALLNLGFGTNITNKKGKTALKISLTATNIFDTVFQNHLSRLKYFEPYPNDARGKSGIYGMGRNIGLRVCVPLF
jgi:iron complex outermembrane recepter protein